MRPVDIPNVDGKYQTKDKAIKITVTRKAIRVEVEVPAEDEVRIIDENPGKGGGKSVEDITARMNRMGKVIHAGINMINEGLQ